jgi:hypothetical protein
MEEKKEALEGTAMSVNISVLIVLNIPKDWNNPSLPTKKGKKRTAVTMYSTSIMTGIGGFDKSLVGGTLLE